MKIICRKDASLFPSPALPGSGSEGMSQPRWFIGTPLKFLLRDDKVIAIMQIEK